MVTAPLLEALETIVAEGDDVSRRIAGEALSNFRRAKLEPQVPPTTLARNPWTPMQLTTDGEEIPHDEVVRDF